MRSKTACCTSLDRSLPIEKLCSGGWWIRKCNICSEQIAEIDLFLNSTTKEVKRTKA